MVSPPLELPPQTSTLNIQEFHRLELAALAIQAMSSLSNKALCGTPFNRIGSVLKEKELQRNFQQFFFSIAAVSFLPIILEVMTQQ